MTCCSQRQLNWGLSGNPRQWATIFCLSCRHVYRRDVPLHEAGIQRDEIEAAMGGGERVSELRQVDVKELRALEDERDVLAAERAALLEQVVYWRECAEELKGERDELAGELRSHKAAIDGLQAERDALAAHLDKFYALVGQSRYDDVFDLIVRELINNAPATSLAKLKAESQAEALESLGNHFMIGDSHKGFILGKAAELRRQAEEPAE